MSYGFPGDETPIVKRQCAARALESTSRPTWNAPEYESIRELLDGS